MAKVRGLTARASRLGEERNLLSIPNYQQFMEPCLKVLAGEGLIAKKELIAKVSDEVGLTEQQRQIMLDSGKATVTRSRISWALAYMK